jgi:broad specificity phosphatase PhoE
MKQLIFVRHGMPDEGNAARPHDPPLNGTGLRQAEELGKHLSRERVDLVVSSPQMRAQNTAAPLAALLRLPIVTLKGLAEVDLHTDRYRSPQTIRKEYPDRWDAFLKSPAGFFGWDEETFRLGVVSAVAETMKSEATTIAVFTHGTPIRTMVQHALGPERAPRFPIGHCSITRLAGLSIDALNIQCVNESVVTQVTV